MRRGIIVPAMLSLLVLSTPILRAEPNEIGNRESDGTMSFTGMVLPGTDGDSFRLRGRFGTFTVKLSSATVLGYECFRSLDMEKRHIRITFFDFSIPVLRDKVIEKTLPPDLYASKTYYPPEEAQKNWRRELDAGEIRSIDGVYATPLAFHTPTRDEPWFSARIESVSDPKAQHKKYYATVDGKRVEFGLGVYPFVWGVVSRAEIVPYATEAKVFGVRDGGTITARRVAIRPVGDPVQHEDPNLPRYLFIGDSISIGYNAELRRLLSGRVNLYHPPTNCGPSGKGVGWVNSWLGAYEEPGRGWDVISFNFGHWDAGNSKEVYQRNLEQVISMLRNTGAELIFVTTTPVDKAYPLAGDLVDRGSKGLCAPGRTHGVMEKYINPWALEVVKRHPEIAICDHWQIVKDGEDGLYREWWHGKNVHFRDTRLNTPLAQALAGKVLEALETKKARVQAGKRPTPRSPVNAWE